MENKKLHLFEFNCLFYFLIRASFIGILCNNLLMIAKQDSWISIIVGSILGFIPLFIYYLLLKIDINENIFGIIKKVFGKIFGQVINSILLVFVFIFAIIVLTNLVNFISIQYLDKTPQLVIAILSCICIYYLLAKNISIIGRVAVILFYISIFLLVINIFGWSLQINFNNIKPILEFGVMNVFNGSMHFIAYSILPLFLLGMVPKKEIEKSKHFFRNISFFYLFTCITILLTIFSVLSIHGVEFAKIIPYPEINLLSHLSGFSRFESILGIQWVFDFIIFISLCMIFIKKGLFQLLNMRHNKFINLVLIVLLFFGYYSFNNMEIKNNFLVNFFPSFIVLILFGIPSCTLLFYKIKKHLI